MMPNDRKEPGRGTSPEIGALSNILADMLRSALAWEEQHGLPPLMGKSKDENAAIHTGFIKLVVDPGGKQDDDNFTPNNKTDK
jgi:hypothetical protein